MIRRRDFIALLGGAAAAWPLWTLLPRVTRAAPPARSVTIGVIAPLSFPAIEGLRKGFRDLGYVEGKNLRLEYRWAEGPPSDMSASRRNCSDSAWTQSLPGAHRRRWARDRRRRAYRSLRRP
jgi:hypothetical protein